MLTIKQINLNIRAIAKFGLKLDIMLHETGVAIMQHAETHGDYTAVNRMLAVFPKNSRKLAYIAWFEAHTPFNYDAKLEAFKRPKNAKRAFMIEEATAVPFWEYSKEVAPKVKDIDAMIAFVVKSITKALEEGKEVKGDISKLAILKPLVVVK